MSWCDTPDRWKRRFLLDKTPCYPYCAPVREGRSGTVRFAEGMTSVMKTYQPKAGEIDRRWILVDAAGKNLGRLATVVANLLHGKGKPSFVPHLDVGDFVVVINAEKVVLSGKKETDKLYMSYSGWKGGEKYRSVTQIRARHPEKLITHAVKGMLPKNRLGDRLLTKLKVCQGDVHRHTAQQPVPLARVN